MDQRRPACPTCGAIDERPSDALGVHLCSTCAIEFRPSGRMPIRRATISGGPNNEVASWFVAVVLIGVMVGLAVGFGDRKPPTPLEFKPIQVPTFEPPVLDPITLEAMQFAPLAVVPLHYDIHRSQIADGELFATGVITASDASAVEELTLEVIGRNREGAPLSIPRAVVSCKTMQPGEDCAWMIDTEAPRTLAELEFHASGRRSLQIGPPQLDLRSEREGELDFDPKKRTVKFVTRDRALRDAWVTVTAYSPEQRVLGVAETRVAGRHAPGRMRFDVAVPSSPDEVGYYEVRVGGELFE